jgi:hypothetical protein
MKNIDQGMRKTAQSLEEKKIPLSSGFASIHSKRHNNLPQCFYAMTTPTNPNSPVLKRKYTQKV